MTEFSRTPGRSIVLASCVILALALGACASGGATVNTVPVAHGTRYVGPYAWGGLDRLVGRRFSWSDWTISSDGWKSFRWEVPGEVLVVEQGDSANYFGASRYTLDPATGVVVGYQLHSDGSLVTDNGAVSDGKRIRLRMRVINDHQYEDVVEELNGTTWQVPFMGRTVYTSNEQRAANQRERDNFWGGLASGALTMAQTYADTQSQINARNDAATAYAPPAPGPVPYYSAPAPAPATPARDTQSGGGSAGAANSGRIIPIQFHYAIPMRPAQGDTSNRFCRSNIVALSDRVDLDSNQSREQAMATAGRFRATFLEKCNRLGTTDNVGNLQLTIHGMNTRRTAPFVAPSHPSDYRVTLP